MRHYALAHGGLNKCLAAISEESGVHDGVIALTLQGILKDETRLPTIVKCELCEKKFNQEFVKQHQILKHFLLNYSEEISGLFQRNEGDCPVFDCQVRKTKRQSINKILK